MKRFLVCICSWLALLLIPLATSGCFADQGVPDAPTDQLIRGPFTIGPEWQTIKFDKPLSTLPHIQHIVMLLDNDAYEYLPDAPPSEFNTVYAGFKQVSTNTMITPELIFIDTEQREFRSTNASLAVGNTLVGEPLQALSYGINPRKAGKFYFPKDVEFIALKVKSNVTMRVEHFSWRAPYYYRSPGDTWDDVSPSEILDWD